jgi:hypothetical protein
VFPVETRLRKYEISLECLRRFLTTGSKIQAGEECVIGLPADAKIIGGACAVHPSQRSIDAAGNPQWSKPGEVFTFIVASDEFAALEQGDPIPICPIEWSPKSPRAMSA